MPGKLDYHWTFGDNCHIEFQGGGAPVTGAPQAFRTNEGCASIADAAGALLFYTDGRRLYDGANAPKPPTPPGSLGGNTTSCQSAIIVPPAGGGKWYHIFAVDSWEPATNPARAVTHSAVVPAGATVAFTAPPTQLTPGSGPTRAAERLAAVQHQDCDRYWVVALYMDGAFGLFHAIRVDGDAVPTHEVTSPYPSPGPGWVPIHEFSMRFSPDGSLLAVAARGTIDIMRFDRATGAITSHSQVTGLTGQRRVYGLEFSPNGQYLYYSCHLSGDVRRHAVNPAGGSFGTSDQIDQWGSAWAWPPNPPINYRIGALQIGPNGKIYGALFGQSTLFEIGDPDNGTPALTQFKAPAAAAGGGPLNLNSRCRLGLPNFVRMTGDCDDRCAAIAGEVDALLTEQEAAMQNRMVDCRGEPVPEPRCAPLEVPALQPQTYISWGASRCDCIESDDTEIMYLTVCNPYANVTLSGLTVHQLVVVDDNGQPVATLPDGSPSIQLTPVGPYCFDDIAPCSCLTRQFVLRLRGAPHGRYRILVRGICFDACLHGDAEACFAFEVCKD